MKKNREFYLFYIDNFSKSVFDKYQQIYNIKTETDKLIVESGLAYYMKFKLGLTYRKIADIFGLNAHASIIHKIRMFENRVDVGYAEEMYLYNLYNDNREKIIKSKKVDLVNDLRAFGYYSGAEKLEKINLLTK